MHEQQASTSLPKEAYLGVMYVAFVAIRSAKSLPQAQKIANLFHNLPSHLQQEKWDDEKERAVLAELMTSAEAIGLTDELEEWLDAAADTWMIEAKLQKRTLRSRNSYCTKPLRGN